MQVAYAAVSSAARVAFLGFTSAGSVLSSVVSGILVFWLWWATTSPIRQSARANGPHAKGSRSTQQQGETEAGQPKGGADRSTISADTNSPSALSRAEALQVARTAREEHAADRVCDGHGLEDVLDDGAYVSPLGNRLRVSAGWTKFNLWTRVSHHVCHGCMVGVSQDQHWALRCGLA
jgi:hypothetical protein